MVFDCLRWRNLCCKASKCMFLTPEVKFLGYVISKKGTVVDPAKTEAVGKWLVATLVHDIWVFLGLCNYYQRFIWCYADIARPLTNPTRKDIPFIWSNSCKAAF